MIKKIHQSFNKQARKIFLGAAVMTGTLFSAEKTNAQMHSNLQLQPPVSALQLKTSPQDSLRKAFNDSVMRDARADYPRLMHVAANDYSRHLDSLEVSINQKLNRQGEKFRTRAVIIDQNAIDLAYALSYSRADAIKTVLKDKDAMTSDDNINAIIRAMSYRYMSPGGSVVPVVNPCVQFFDSTHIAYFLATTSPMPQSFTVNGATMEESIAICNTHESWHIFDDRYVRKGMSINRLELAIIDLLPLEQRTAFPAWLEYFSMNYKSESLADVGALGDIIRGGGDTALIGKMIEFRASGDMIHMSCPVLEGLRARIDGMGLENFRQLDDKQARALYYDVVDTYGMSEKAFDYQVQFMTGDSAKKENIKKLAEKDPEARKVIALNKFLLDDTTYQRTMPAPLDMHTKIRLEVFDATKELQNRAAIDEGKVTPASVIRAYVAMSAEIREQIKKNPTDPSYPEKLLKLRSAYIKNLDQIDYYQWDQDLNHKSKPAKSTTYVMTSADFKRRA